MKILLIAGHGDGDCGALGCDYEEANLTREVVGLLKTQLGKYADVDVFDTSKNMYKYLQKNSFNFKKYAYVFEVHFNACVDDETGNGVTTGTEILVHPSEAGTGVERAILENISALGFKNRGVKVRSNLQNMNVCKGSQGVSYALLETCFIDDADDVKLYQAKKSAVITAITNGIVSGFGLTKETEAADVAKFKDTAGHYAEKTIDELTEMGVVNGKGDGTFSPNEPITRADACIIARNVIRYITGK